MGTGEFTETSSKGAQAYKNVHGNQLRQIKLCYLICDVLPEKFYGVS